MIGLEDEQRWIRRNDPLTAHCIHVEYIARHAKNAKRQVLTISVTTSQSKVP